MLRASGWTDWFRTLDFALSAAAVQKGPQRLKREPIELLHVVGNF